MHVMMIVLFYLQNTCHVCCWLLSQNQKLRLELEKRKQKQHIMDVLNKFKSTLQSSVSSTVFSTVSTIKDVLPGNPVTREYEVGDHIASAGPGKIENICLFFNNKMSKYFIL